MKARIFALCLLASSCAPRPPIVAAPCPCPEGYVCAADNTCQPNTCPCPAGFVCNGKGTCDALPKPPGPLLSETCKGQFPAARQFPLFPEQYVRTLAQLTGSPPSFFLPPRYAGQAGDKFTTTGQTLRVSSEDAALFQQNATMAAALLLDALGAGGCIPEDANSHAACRELLLTRTAAAYRRPLYPGEISSIEALLNKGTAKLGFKQALAVAFEAVLQSPQFLYRSELGNNQAGGISTLTDYEIASALSYSLSDDPPDQALLDDAQQGRLGAAEVRGQHARRLLSTPAAQKKFRDFFFQLFRLNKPVSLEGAPADFEDIVESMQLETNRFLDRHLWDPNGNITTLFTSTTTWVDARLAAHYGITAPAIGEEGLWTTIAERKGLLANGRVLVAHPNSRKHLPLRRAMMVMDNLQCLTLPFPSQPISVSAFTESLSPDTTAREAAEAFLSKNGPACRDCHEITTRLALAFEQFDEFGRYRTEQFGKPIDATFVDKDLGTFANGFDYVQALMKERQGQECLITHLASSILGLEPRSRGDEAVCVAERLYARWSSGSLRFPDLLVQMVEDDSFIKRRFTP